MKLLLQSIKIVAPNSSNHLKVLDVLITNGVVSEIAKKIEVEKDYKVFAARNASISPAWLDTNMHIFEPGLEYREDFKSGLNAAAKAGFASVCILPNTNPTIDNNTQITFVKSHENISLAKPLAYGAVSQKVAGKDLAEIYDMHYNGAVGFTDGSEPILNAGLMERALLYVKKFNGLVLSNPDNVDLAHESQMNEGVNSTLLGMKGAPKLAEELMVARDLYLLEHTNSKLHFLNVSTKKSVELIREAKQKGLQVTAGVAVYNLSFQDDALMDFDTNYKVKPYLRNAEDVAALLEGLKDGTIDVICSGHTPLHEDEKKVEFENASFGMSTIDAVFGAARKATLQSLSETELISKFTNGYTILGRDIPKIELGDKLVASVYSVDEKYTLEKSALYSKGKNNPYLGKELQGKALGIIQQSKTNIL